MDILAKCTIDDNGCWIWQGAIAPNGYGTGYANGRTRNMHRVSYETYVGPIPVGLVIDHLCRVRHCMNPEHLEAVTQRENLLRGKTVTARNAATTHCPQGHEYTEENTRVQEGSRICIACKREKDTAYNRAKGHKPHGWQTHCVNGHEFDEANTRYNKDGGRICRACSAERGRRYRREKRERNNP